ncbi:NAD(P)/FAD-dependent oxidoreductase [Microbacterium sp. CJ88]|uniref:NAD(P)/FAD-dependent oxidoreductase n=1 Tax=Microbacterium sp. CJ88 TaxID=3445672 RepID=UPI003F658524
MREHSVVSVARDGDGFAVTTGEGMLRARRLVLATGMRDELPAIPGIAEAWGREVAQCPFCHGHELTGRPIALLGEPPHVLFQEALLTRIASELTVIAPGDLVRVERTADGLRLELADGSARDAAGLFLAATPHQAAPFAEALGCGILPSGCVEVDGFGRTTVPGVYAAGDLAHTAAQPGPLVSLAAAIAAGQLAAVGLIRDALED